MKRSQFFRIAAGIFGALAFALPVCAQLTKDEKKGIADALFVGNLIPADLGFARKTSADPHFMKFIEDVIASPLDGADRLMELHQSSSPELARTLQRLSQFIYPGESSPVGSLDGSFSSPPEVPEAYRAPLESLARAVALASSSVRSATEKLTPEQKRSLIESLPQIALQPHQVRFDFVTQKPLPFSESEALLEQIDWPKIRAASQLLAESVDAQIPRLTELAKNAPFTGQLKVNFGRMVVALGGIGSNEHSDKDAVLTVDLGGNDIYRGRHGAGVGYASVLIDCSGDDLYDVSDLSVGAGLMGIGIAVDGGGDDIFRGKSICFGSGLAGVGVFKKSGGQDVLQVQNLAAGFGFWGAGIYMDTGGNDSYDAHSWAFGSARPQGTGWLIDRDGDDRYRTSGPKSEGQLSSMKASFSMGFGSGIDAQIAGGIGLLTDLKGRDDYVGDSSCQAAGQFGGLGSLYDGEGDDGYRAYHAAQSNSSVGGSAYLFDLSGDDLYAVNVGACHARSAEFGTSVLFDRSGNDIYAARDSRPALAQNSGLALFIDVSGEDRYAGPAGVGISQQSDSSLAIFLDLNGADKYGEGLQDGSATYRPGFGLGYDAETSGFTSNGEELPPLPKPGNEALGSDEVLEAIFAEMSAGASTVREAALRKFLAKGMPAYQWLLDNKLVGASMSTLHSIGRIGEAIGADARNATGFKVGDANDAVALAALQICADFGFKEAGPMMVSALKRPALTRLAARSAGLFGEVAPVPELMVACASKDRLTVVYALRSLAVLSDSQAIGTGQSLMNSPDFMIRQAATQLVAKFPDLALTIGQSMSRAADEREARVGVELLSAIGTKEAIDELCKLLGDGRAGVRLQAGLGLHGRCPVDKRGALAALRRDVDPRVRLAAAGIDPGR